MPKLIKNKELVPNEWEVLKEFDSETLKSLLDKKLFVTIDTWLNLTAVLVEKQNKNELGLFIDSHQSCDDLPENFHLAPAIAINFPAFTDGRGYSIAKDLRVLRNYLGEVRAVGEVLHDQLNAMMRCGFDAFELMDDKDAAKALLSFDDWTQKYQADLIESRPVYLR